jgi:hypothetical protein
VVKSRAWAALLVVLVMVVPVVAGAQEHPPPRAHDQPDSLVPFFLLAVAVERFWETLFTLVENGTVTLGRLLGSFAGPLKKLKSELAASRETLAAAAEKLIDPKIADPAYAALDTEFRRAEQRLERTRRRVELVTRDPVYISLKRSIILVGSLVLGPLLAWSCELRLFRTLGLEHIPGWIDVVLTGLIVGTGSEPTHNLLGALGGLRAALCSLAELPRRLANGEAPRAPVEARDDAREDADDEGAEADPEPAAPPAAPRPQPRRKGSRR